MMVRSFDVNMKVWRNRYERKFNDSCFIIIVFLVLQYIGKNIVMKKMTTSLEEEKYDAFFKTSQSILCFLFVKPYIKESMKLSAYIAQEKKVKR